MNNLSGIAETWVVYMVDSNWQFILFTVLVIVFTRMFRSQSARFLYTIWLLALMKLLLPVHIKLPTFISSSNIPIGGVLPDVSISGVASISTISWQNIILIGWSIVAGAMLVIWIFQYLRFNKLLTQCTLLPEFESKTNGVQVLTGTTVQTPFAKGIRNPRIYLPQKTLELTQREIHVVLAHEMAHIQRKDTLWIAIQNMVQIAFFFNPLVWYMNSKLTQYREKACDDLAIQALETKPLEYSRFLLNTLDRYRQWRPVPLLTNQFHQTNRTLIDRFKYLTRRKEAIMLHFSMWQKGVLLALMIVGIAFACEKSDSVKSSDNGANVESLAKDAAENPVPDGGFGALMLNLKYPEAAKKAGIEGKVFVEVTIKSTGAIENSQITKSFGNAECDQAALEAVKMTKWIPAMVDGKAIDKRITIPFAFKLQNENLKAEQHDGNPVNFVAYDEPPQPIGGFVMLQKNLVYPETARKEGVEGKVMLQVNIDESGIVQHVNIVQSLNAECDEAAINAVKSTKWEPARQQDKSVAVWVSIPIVFKLS
ncbi:M56 family metallopeptidase [candidate division KSB1 bacterium]|nr:M56 family metallopeptidase [candidate division KSB1 bacterium]